MENSKDIDFDTFGTMKDQRYSVVPEALTRFYALHMADFNTRTLASMGTGPEEEIDRLSELGQKLSSQRAIQEALGDPSIVALGKEWESFLFQSQAAALARGVLAAARAAGLPAEGKAWGAFKSFYDQLGNDFKVTVLADQVKMDINGSWINALEKQRDVDFPELSSNFSLVDAVIKRPLEQPDAYEVKVGGIMSMMQTKSAHKALGIAMGDASVNSGLSQKDMARQNIEEIVKSLATFASLAAMRESETGISWREQPFTSRFKTAVDVHLSSVAQTIVATSLAAGLNPESEPKMLAGMSTAMSLMSSSESRRITEWLSGVSWLSGTQAGPDLGAEIKRLAQVAYDKANAKWKAGVAVQADTSRVGCQEVLVDPNIKIDSQHSDRREAPTFKDDTQMGNMRDLNDGVLLGEWRPEHQGKTGSYDRFYAVGKGAGGALVSAKNAVSKFVDTFYIEATQEAREVVEMVNTWTDRAEQKMKSASEAGLRAISGALDGAIAVAAGAADQAKQKVVGVVGEAKRASAQGVGMIALAAMDKIPAIDTMEPMSPKTVALLQVAGLAGALLVGVSMAPVVGLATATVGAAAAGYGVGSALNKFAGVFRSSMAELPGKLESFAGKLGARRGGKLVSVEPSVGRENGPGLGAFGAQGF